MHKYKYMYIHLMTRALTTHAQTRQSRQHVQTVNMARDRYWRRRSACRQLVATGGSQYSK